MNIATEMVTQHDSPPRIVVAIVVAGFVASYCGIALWLSQQLLLIEPFRTLLPPIVTGGVVGIALGKLAPHAFPFWRDRLSIAERKRLMSGAIIGPVIGFPLAVLASFMMLDPNLGAPIHSPRLMAFIYLVVAASALIGGYITAVPMPSLQAAQGLAPRGTGCAAGQDAADEDRVG